MASAVFASGNFKPAALGDHWSWLSAFAQPRTNLSEAAPGCQARNWLNEGGRWLVTLRGAETHARSVLKAVSWRTLGTVDTFVISWFMTGKLALAGSIAGLEFVTKIAWYYLHERIWAAIHWGRRHH
jgi:uncharacterized membrane protein